MLERKLSDFGIMRKGAMKGDTEPTIAQTACLLHRECGNLLDRHTASQDAYYALSDIFRFVASAEAQFLEMMQVVLAREMDPQKFSLSEGQKPRIMADLLYNRQVLMRHVQHIHDVLRFMENRERSEWSESKAQTKNLVSDKMSGLLLEDFRYLLKRAEFLADEYQSSMAMLMNAASIDESQRAITQAEGVAKLTTLAFFFVPISFTTSIFGMNFRELSTGNFLSIWVWALTAFASLLFSFVCLKWFSWRRNDEDRAWLKERMGRLQFTRQRSMESISLQG